MTITKPISFRLDSESRKRVDNKAKLLGVKTSDFARNLVLESLNDESELAKLRMKVSLLEEAVLGFRDDLAVAIKALLITKGSEKIVTPDQAEAWVNSNMKTIR
jgi:predicted DNA-binding protein